MIVIMADNVLPLRPTKVLAAKMVRELAEDGRPKIVIIGHSRKRVKQRNISRPQIEACIQKGSRIEGPFLNEHHNWQMTIFPSRCR